MLARAFSRAHSLQLTHRDAQARCVAAAWGSGRLVTAYGAELYGRYAKREERFAAARRVYERAAALAPCVLLLKALDPIVHEVLREALPRRDARVIVVVTSSAPHALRLPSLAAHRPSSLVRALRGAAVSAAPTEAEAAAAAAAAPRGEGADGAGRRATQQLDRLAPFDLLLHVGLPDSDARAEMARGTLRRLAAVSSTMNSFAAADAGAREVGARRPMTSAGAPTQRPPLLTRPASVAGSLTPEFDTYLESEHVSARAPREPASRLACAPLVPSPHRLSPPSHLLRHGVDSSRGVLTVSRGALSCARASSRTRARSSATR